MKLITRPDVIINVLPPHIENWHQLLLSIKGEILNDFEKHLEFLKKCDSSTHLGTLLSKMEFPISPEHLRGGFHYDLKSTLTQQMSFTGRFVLKGKNKEPPYRLYPAGNIVTDVPEGDVRINLPNDYRELYSLCTDTLQKVEIDAGNNVRGYITREEGRYHLCELVRKFDVRGSSSSLYLAPLPPPKEKQRRSWFRRRSKPDPESKGE